MQQLALFESKTVLDIARSRADKLSQEFLDWLPDNLHVWKAFVHETQKIIDRGFKHYSSYTIIEFLRHHSVISDSHASYKLNNNHRPYLSRLFGMVYPEHAGLFEYRTTTKPTGKA